MSYRKGLWYNIRKNKGSGKKPTPEMLEQERKIKANTGKGKKYPDGKGKKNVVYVPDEKTLKLEQQARTDSTASYQESEQLRAKITQQSADYEASMKKLQQMSDDEYLEKGDAVEAENNRINDDSRANAKRLLNKTPNKYREKGIEPSGSVKSAYLGKTMSFPTYSPPKTTVELKKEEEEKKVEEEKVEEKKVEEKPIAVAKPIVASKPIVKKAPVAVKSVEKKEEPKVDYKGKIKYIPDASGPVKYFFIDGSGRKIPLPEHEAKRRQKVDNTEIVKVMKNKKMPMGIKYNNGRKAQYTYKKGRKKYALGAVLGSLAGKAATGASTGASGIMSTIGKGLGGSEATPLGKTSNAFGLARDVTNFIGQYGKSGNEKANKVASIFNSAAGVTNTLDTSIKDKAAEKKSKENIETNTDEADPETPIESFRKGRMFPYGKGNKKMRMGMKYIGGKGKKKKK